MGEFPPERIRNLSIIAHIDHGKSTLADRLLQMTGTVPPSSNPQFLDKLKVERERGITVKAQTVSIIHTHTDGQKYLINLIDTPGHVDFSYEVSRSLGACEGGLLLVDCSQGIQAQTLSVFHHALEANLKLLPVINKVDLPHASPEETSEEIETSLGLPIKDHMRISAKSGLGVENVLNNVIDNLPSPKNWVDDDGKLRGLIFDTFYDQFRGVVSLVRIFSGTLKKGDKVRFLQAGKRYEILEVGINNPEEVVVDQLKDGQVGYIVCNMKNSEEAFIGDTICWADKPVEPLPGFKPMKAMVYAGVFPMDSSDFPKLEESIERLTLNDRSVSIQRESSAALSQGFRLGFLGTLHMDVFKQRLEDEYSSEVIVTAPTVPYKVVYLNGTEEYVSNPVDFPEVGDSKLRVRHIEEPMINATIFVPNEYIGEMMDLCSRYRGVQQEYRILENSDRAILRYSLPLAEIVTDFFSELKSSSSGFASFDYEEAGYQQSNLVKLNILINGKPVDALAMIVHKFAAQNVGKAWVKKLKEVVPRQQFELSLQAAVGAKVIARENVSAFRKDVTAGLYGGHYDRKLKHLNKQKEGKKRLKKLAGNIEIPQTAFFQVLSSRPRSLHTSARAPSLAFTSCSPSIPFPPGLSPNSPMLTSFSSSSFPWQSTNDPITRNLPEPEPESPTLPPQTTSALAPIGRSPISPPDRSSKLSLIGRMTSSPPPADATSSKLSEAFQDLYASTPDSHVFTPGEILEIITALLALQKREGGDRRLFAEQLNPLFRELEDIVGDKFNALKGMELSILSSTSRLERKVQTKDILDAEKAFREVFPRIPDANDAKGLKRWKKGINHLMYLCALAGHQSRLQDWWDKLERNGLSPDSYSHLTRCILADKLGRLEDIPGILDQAFSQDGSEMSEEDKSVLVNFGIHAFARGPSGNSESEDGYLASAIETYSKIVEMDQGDHQNLLGSTTSHGTTTSNPNPIIPIPSNLKPTQQLFGPLLFALVTRGNLIGSLTVFKHIFQNGCTPSIKDYITLFKGFAMYGQSTPPAYGGGEAYRVFGINSFSGYDRKMERESFQDIWERGSSFSEERYEARPPKMEGKGSEWNLENLKEIYLSFLSLTPPSSLAGSNRGINKKQFWIILKSFARTSGGDLDVIEKVWREVEGKFGEGNEQGWVGWRVDNRLIWARRTLFGEEK
ncbi:GTP-binding protein LepA [Kwoniella bestiolae CBS 10118]|uniref:GTP-binding protein LepA n=1 Tax=Kwoniella bestiolae CBS 10118 TaxID=1296100 RepID=A0AAJ8MBL0_9TREE